MDPPLFQNDLITSVNIGAPTLLLFFKDLIQARSAGRLSPAFVPLGFTLQARVFGVCVSAPPPMVSGSADLTLTTRTSVGSRLATQDNGSRKDSLSSTSVIVENMKSGGTEGRLGTKSRC